MTKDKLWRAATLMWMAGLVGSGCGPVDEAADRVEGGSQTTGGTGAIQAHAAHVAELDAWHGQRLASLTRPDGWLSLVGLYWLPEGSSTFGAATGNDLVAPVGAPALIGTFERQGAAVSLRPGPGVDLMVDETAFAGGELATDAAGNPTVLTLERWTFYLIERDGRFGVRLKDRQSPTLTGFGGIERFPADARWRVPARFEPYDPPRRIAVPTVLETVVEQPCPGALVFEWAGEEHRLDPIAEEGDESWWLIFADATNGDQTYGGGRFLVVPAPGEDGTTVVDFNRAYNPPCAFSAFATCPLPPRQNRLSVAVTAGEMAYGDGAH